MWEYITFRTNYENKKNKENFENKNGRIEPEHTECPISSLIIWKLLSQNTHIVELVFSAWSNMMWDTQ